MARRGALVALAVACTTACDVAEPPQPALSVGVIAPERVGAVARAFARERFRIVRERPDADASLVADGRDARPRYASVAIYAVPDPHTAILSLQKDDLDVVYGLPEALLAEARADGLYPARDNATRAWCAYSVDLQPSRRACPPAASAPAPGAERSSP